MEWLTQPLFIIGKTRVSLATLGVFLGTLVGVVVVARMIGALVGGRLLARTTIDRGLRYALGRIVYYVLLVAGFLIAFQTSGIEVGGLALILSAFGVGIGFGLQTIVNNFVSGLILLLERPIKVGDWIEIDGKGGQVDRIGTRSTTIVTNDNITMIVPNAELIGQRIVNWSHGDPTVRIRLPVGVAYGSDLDIVRAALLDVAAAHSAVLPTPPPRVNFIAFGDSALEMELAVWTREGVQRQRRFRSDLNFAIDAAFRARGIQIPFPQRDVHIRTGGAPTPGSPPD